MRTLSEAAGLRNLRHGIAFFDKIQVRMKRMLTDKQMVFLREHCRSVDQRIGHPIRNSKADWLLTTVCADEKALKFIAARRGAFINFVECAFDIPTDNPERMVDLFDAHFVQPRHGRDNFTAQEHGTYTRHARPGIRFVWYGDKLSKKVGVPCLHLEARAHGVAAVRRVGINEPGDLLQFNHAEFWKQNLSLLTIDLERLGRWHENKRRGERRRHSVVEQFGPISYNRDRAIGAALYRRMGETKDFAAHCARAARAGYADECDVPTDASGYPRRMIDRSVQQFVKTVGRGSWLSPMSHALCLYATSNVLNESHCVPGTTATVNAQNHG